MLLFCCSNLITWRLASDFELRVLTEETKFWQHATEPSCYSYCDDVVVAAVEDVLLVNCELRYVGATYLDNTRTQQQPNFCSRCDFLWFSSGSLEVCNLSGVYMCLQ